MLLLKGKRLMLMKTDTNRTFFDHVEHINQIYLATTH